MLNNDLDKIIGVDVYSNNNDGGDNEDDRYGKQSIFEWSKLILIPCEKCVLQALKKLPWAKNLIVV